MPEKTGVIFDIQRYSLHDGPGIRTVVFVKGCLLRCLWCQNPESQDFRSEIIYIEDNCINCEACVYACPAGAISKETLRIAKEICINCEKCADACPANAKRLIGRRVTVDEVLAEVEKDRLFYRSSGGGVTISGGEPMVQHEFVARLLEKCQERSIHTTIETCGYAKWNQVQNMLRHLDLVLYDIKHMDPEQHVKLTGVSNELILRNAARIAKTNVHMIVRIPIIPGSNDSEDNVESIAKFVVSLITVNTVEFLGYHRLGEPKCQWLGREYPMKDVSPPTREHLERLARIVSQYGLNVLIGV
jgi:pyruvate formate lyase activating enzyme